MDANRLANINRYINQVIPFNDNVKGITNSLADATTNGGKCRDYAKWKANTLLMAGADRNQLRVLYGLYNKTPHSVLAYYPQDGGEPLILDNMRQQILPLSQRRQVQGFESMPLPENWK